MLPVKQSSQTAKEGTESPISPTPEMEDLAKKVIDKLAKSHFRISLNEGAIGVAAVNKNKVEETDFLVRVFCRLEKNNIDDVHNEARFLAGFCRMDLDDVAKYVTLSGYKITWIWKPEGCLRVDES